VTLGKIGVGLLGGIGLMAAALWFYNANTWPRFDDTPVDRLARAPSTRDVTHLLGDILPKGMRGEDAFRLLNRNGFLCASADTTSNGNSAITCARRVSHFPCGGTFSVELLLSNAGSVVNRAATSTYVCV
jgi:hypothetical protein